MSGSRKNRRVTHCISNSLFIYFFFRKPKMYIKPWKQTMMERRKFFHFFHSQLQTSDMLNRQKKKIAATLRSTYSLCSLQSTGYHEERRSRHSLAFMTSNISVIKILKNSCNKFFFPFTHLLVPFPLLHSLYMFLLMPLFIKALPQKFNEFVRNCKNIE